jgi:hypothetical protein
LMSPLLTSPACVATWWSAVTRSEIASCSGSGIPCGIGIGTTKTLANLANHIAKTAERKPGSYPNQLARVCNLAALNPTELDAVLASTPVNEVWGVGRQTTNTWWLQVSTRCWTWCGWTPP